MPGDATPIQAISLQFTGDNESALSAIDSLIAKLEQLQGIADKGLNLNVSSKIDNIGKSARSTKTKVDDLAKSVQQISMDMPVKEDVFEPISVSSDNAKLSVADLAETIKSINNAVADVNENAGESISSLAAKFENAGTRIANTLSSLAGGKGLSGTIIENIGLPMYSQASMATTMGLPEKSSAVEMGKIALAMEILTEHAGEWLDYVDKANVSLTETDATMKSIVGRASLFGGFLSSTSLSSLAEAQKTPLLPAQSLASIIKSADGLFNTDNALKGIAKDAHEAYTNLNKVAGLLPSISSAQSMKEPYQPLSMQITGLRNTSIQDIGEQTVKVHGLTAALGGLKVALDKLKGSKLAAGVGKVGSILTMEIPKSQMSIKTLGKIASDTATRFTKLLASIKRVALYRAIRAAIKAITNAFKEGVNNLYDWSNAFDSTREFANSMDRIATAALYVKNSLGALVAPIINTLAPALDYLADKFVGVLNIINEFLAAITGAETYTVARKIATQFKEAEEGASGAAKALKSFTIGIDELNIIEDTGRSGGGAGGLANDVEDWFEKQEVSNKMKQFVDDLKIYGDGISQWAEDTIKSLKSVADFWGTLGEEDYWNYMKSPEGITDTLANVAAVVSPFPLYALGINAVVNGLTDLFDLLKEDPLGASSAFFTNAPLFIGFLESIQDLSSGDFTQLKKIIEDVLKVMPLISPLFGGKQGSNFLNNITRPLDRLQTVWNNLKTGVEAIVDGIKKVPELIASGWEYNLKQVKKVLDKIWEIIKKISQGGIGNLWSGVFGGGDDESEVESKGANLTDRFLSGVATTVRAYTPVLSTVLDTLLRQSGGGIKFTALEVGRETADCIKRGFTSGASSIYQKVGEVGRTALSTFKSNASYSDFKSAGENIVNGIIAGLDAKKGSVYKSISVLAEKTGSKFNYTLKIQSPSKVFEESGYWIVAGLNKGIEENERSTAKVVDGWLSTFSNLSANVDISKVSMPGISAMADEVQGSIMTNGSISVKNETEDIKAFFENTVIPIMNGIAEDTKRQADKEETTEIYMDSRKVTESVNKQNRVNGFSFTGV